MLEGMSISASFNVSFLKNLSTFCHQSPGQNHSVLNSFEWHETVGKKQRYSSIDAKRDYCRLSCKRFSIIITSKGPAQSRLFFTSHDPCLHGFSGRSIVTCPCKQITLNSSKSCSGSTKGRSEFILEQWSLFVFSHWERRPKKLFSFIFFNPSAFQWHNFEVPRCGAWRAFQNQIH